MKEILRGDIPPDGHPELVRFLDYWREKSGDRPFPSREDIDPTEFPHLLGGICLLDVEWERDHFARARFRLAGTQIYNMIGYDVTGRYVDEVMPRETYDQVQTQLSHIVSSGEPAFRRFQWLAGPTPDIVYERVMAPLGPIGGPVTMLIGMHATRFTGDPAPSREPLSIPVG